MCATPKRHSKNNVGSSGNSSTATPSASDAVADAAAEKELRRLRSLYGRRATILTPERSAMGEAPTVQKNLLGS
ncbi:hypothetical protein [Dongia rigui]|uniref:Uncharacterized protein n=1 Tax=Dongia rigui TaxID=940149 RepID=A0ABU5DYU8_9PROT|nr:hypothetical protein [Dongia rigui]MDY0872507.1 hypothetical protein [Dongia rigui]